MNTENITESVEEAITTLYEEYGDEMLLAVSGGADSTALLTAMATSPYPHKNLRAVHCNFHLRGEESERDMRHVESLCEQFKVPLDIVHFDVQAYRDENGGSVEMACRDLRYAEFKKILDKHGLKRVVTAHNFDDNVETIMLNLFRGTGIKGLTGMQYDNGFVLRPLLSTPREDIEQYLHIAGIEYVTDSTNQESEYRRNFLRNEVIPLLLTRWPDLKRTLTDNMRRFTQESLILDEFSAKYECQDSKLTSAHDDTTVYIPFDKLDCGGTSQWVLEKFAREHGATPPQASEIAACIFSRIIGINPDTGQTWPTRMGRIIAERDRLVFLPGKDEEICKAALFDKKEFECTPELRASIMSAPLSELWVPADTQIEFRHYREGDRMAPLGLAGTTLISKIFKDAKLSQEEKETRWLATDLDTGEILWVEGLKRSRFKPITSQTEKCTRYTLVKA